MITFVKCRFTGGLDSVYEAGWPVGIQDITKTSRYEDKSSAFVWKEGSPG
jgi:hypothetical protein